MLTGSLLVCVLMALTAADDAAVNPTEMADVHPTETEDVHPTEMADVNATETADVNATETTDFDALRCCHEPEWEENNGRRFLYVSTLMTWTDAEKNCQSMAANLASVHSDEENEFLHGLIKKSNVDDPEAWIGGTDCQQNNDFLWSDGSRFTYTHWCQGKPDDVCGFQGCLQMNHGVDHCWDDTECSGTRPSICVINV